MAPDPRAFPVAAATTELRTYLYELAKKHDLTANELMLILTNTSYKLFVELVKKERKTEE